jgi:hypothetical protein
MGGLNPALLALIDEARAAGLSLELKGPKLVVSGPKTAEALALRLLGHKAEVLALLHVGYAQPWPELLPNLTRRSVGVYTLCPGAPGTDECPSEQWTFVRYGDRPTCLSCARYQIESAVVTTTRPSTPKVPA